MNNFSKCQIHSAIFQKQLTVSCLRFVLKHFVWVYKEKKTAGLKLVLFALYDKPVHIDPGEINQARQFNLSQVQHVNFLHFGSRLDLALVKVLHFRLEIPPNSMRRKSNIRHIWHILYIRKTLEEEFSTRLKGNDFWALPVSIHFNVFDSRQAVNQTVVQLDLFFFQSINLDTLIF